MAEALITLEQARAHLRIDDVDSAGGPDDPWLAMAIPAVSEAVALWLKDSWRLYDLERDSNGDVLYDSQGEGFPLLDSNGDPTVRSVVQAACLLELERLDRFRGGEGDADVPDSAGHGYVLGKGATSLLVALRRPTIG